MKTYSIYIILLSIIMMGCSNGNFISIKEGTYTIGCYSDDETRGCRDVKVSNFYISKGPVTLKEWNICVKDGACENITESNVDYATNINFSELENYVDWLNLQDTIQYRLPTTEELFVANIFPPDGINTEWSGDCKTVGEREKMWGAICNKFTCKVCDTVKTGKHLNNASVTYMQDIRKHPEIGFRLIELR